MIKYSMVICGLLASINLLCQIDADYDGVFSVGNIPEMITNQQCNTKEKPTNLLPRVCLLIMSIYKTTISLL